jgi:hypothetical protein
VTNVIPVNLAVEDVLSEAIARKMLVSTRRNYVVGCCYMRHGKAYLHRLIAGFNNAAKVTPFLVLTDLDRGECAPALIRSWLAKPLHANLLFRVAVREVETWLLADGKALSEYMSTSAGRIPVDADSIVDPKEFLISLAAKSRRRDIREDIVPQQGSTAKQGKNYNACLIAFVRDSWEPTRARLRSQSLNKALDRLSTFKPSWT